MQTAAQNVKDINLNKLLLVNYMGEVADLSSIFVQLNIYEDITSNCMSGLILIEDGTNLISNFPIIGQEKLIVSYNNPGLKPKEYVFSVYKIDKIGNKENNDKIQMYNLLFTSSELIKDEITSISRSLKGKTSDVVYNILTQEWGLNYKGSYNIEESESIVNFVSPNWNPYKLINFFTQRSIPINKKCPTYLFYQNMNGYNFVSYESLINKGVSDNWYYALSETNDGYDIDTKVKNVNSYYIEKWIDTIDNCHKGLYSGEYTEVNLASKKLVINKYDYIKDFDLFPSLYPNRILPNINTNYSVNLNTKTKQIVYNNAIDKDVKKFSRWVLLREAWISQLKSICVVVEKTLNSDTQIGDIVNFNIPSREATDNIKYADYLNGKFLIWSNRITIGNNLKGVSTLRLVKDSFSKKLPEKKL